MRPPEASMTRTDIHRPTAIDPDQYDYVDSYDLSTGPDADIVSRRMFHRDVERLETEGKRVADHLDDGWRRTCGTCGQVGLRYVSLVVHNDTGEYMVVGRSCIETTFDSARADLDTRQANAAQARKDAKLLKGFNDMLLAHPEIAEAPALLEQAFTVVDDGERRWHEKHRQTNNAMTLQDIMRKARQYGGNISEKQIAYAARLVTWLNEAEAATAEYEAKRAAAQAVRPNAAIGEVGERREFTGTVVWTKDVPNDFDPYGGEKTIMGIETAEGMIKWFASKVIDVDKGDTVAFRATVKKHDIYEGKITTVVQRPSGVKITKA